MGQFGSTWRKWISPTSWCLIKKKILSISLQLKGQRIQSWSGRRASRNPPAIGHIRVTPPVRAPPLPAPAEHRKQGNPWAQTSKESRLLLHLCQPENHGHLTSEWETLSEGWFFLQEKKKPTAHFIYYIICDCVQFADTLMMVSMYGIFGIWLSQDGMK